MCVWQNAAGVVRQMSQQPTIDRIVQGEQWLETTAVCKDKGKMSTGRRRDCSEDSDSGKEGEMSQSTANMTINKDTINK